MCLEVKVCTTGSLWCEGGVTAARKEGASLRNVNGQAVSVIDNIVQNMHLRVQGVTDRQCSGFVAG